MSHYHPMSDTEYKSLLHDESDVDPADQCSPRFDPGQRRGRQLTSGVAQMLQVWPALLSHMMRTFVLALTACLLFILAIISLFLTSNFSLATTHTLHLHTRSVHTLPSYASLPQSRAHTESLYKYIVTGSDDEINLFYVIDQDRTLEPFARKLLKFYTRAGYKVFLVRVCHTRFVDEEGIEGVAYDKGCRKGTSGGHREMVIGIYHEKGNSERGVDNNDILKRGEKGNSEHGVDENDILKRGMYKRAVNGKFSAASLFEDGSIRTNEKTDTQEARTADSQHQGEDIILTGNGFVHEVAAPSTADIETYDAKLRQEIESDFGASREFFDRIRNILARNRTFEEDEADHARVRVPITSREINVTESDDELKKVQVCTCPGCGHVKSRGRKIFGSDASDPDLAKVEILSVNYREFLRGSMFEGQLAALDGKVSANVGESEKTGIDKSELSENENQVSDNVGVKDRSKPGVQARINSVESPPDGTLYDLNLVKLLLLWKFGNSLVLLDDQATLLHSNLIDRGRVNLGFHLVYSPYECSSVVFNIMREYARHRGRGLSPALGEVYRLFCKRAPRGFCNAITYVRVKRK